MTTVDLVAVVGTRERNPTILAAVTVALQAMPPSTILVTGDCRSGVDLHVRDEAERLGLVCIVVHARARSPEALKERNDVVARLATRGLAFPDTRSRGTWDTVNKLKARGKPCNVWGGHRTEEKR